MSKTNPFGQIFLTTVAAAVLGVLAFHLTDLVTLYLKGIPVQATAGLVEPGTDDRIVYRYTVDGKAWQASPGVLVPVRNPVPGQTVGLRYLKTDPAKAFCQEDFVQAMIETGLGMLIAAGALGLLRWRSAGALRRKT